MRHLLLLLAILSSVSIGYAVIKIPSAPYRAPKYNTNTTVTSIPQTGYVYKPYWNRINRAARPYGYQSPYYANPYGNPYTVSPFSNPYYYNPYGGYVGGYQPFSGPMRGRNSAQGHLLY